MAFAKEWLRHIFFRAAIINNCFDKPHCITQVTKMLQDKTISSLAELKVNCKQPAYSKPKVNKISEQTSEVRIKE